MFITVLDDNDNQPLFPQPLYTWSISEGSLSGQAFIDVAASDIDLGVNMQIDYSIVGGNTGSKCYYRLCKVELQFYHSLLC